MADQATDPMVRREITVAVPRARAFEVFCDQMGSWWPLEGKSIGTVKAETAVLEPRAGGRWFERGVDGSECDWGRVVAYEPPERLVLDWQIGADWRYDADLHTEVEVRFLPEGDGTRVVLVHRDLAAFGDQAGQMAAIFDSPDGWAGILAGYLGAV